MQLVSTLLYLALSIFSANAFYPYGPAWQKELDNGIDVKKGRNDAASGSSDSVTLRLKQRTTHRTVKSHNQRATAEAARLSQKFNGQDALVRRKNAYRVTSATTPSTSDATGIDQDGNDFSYFIEVGLGSKKAKYYMLVDTGAGSSWVMGFECTDEACSKHNTLGPDSSSSLEISDKEFSVSYGTGKVKGKLATDTVSIAGMDLKYKFGLASSTSEEFSKFAFDGIIGLSMANGASDNFLSTLASSGEIKNNVFSVSLSRASDGGSSGEIKFGGTNPAKYTGDITYNSLQSKGDEWAITMDDMSFDGKKANVGGKLAYIDTGTTYVFGPESLVDKLHGVIEGATKHGTYYSVSCDLTKPITVTFSGVDYDIPAKDWITPKDGNGNCFSNIYGQEVVKDSWLMGGTFLKSVYTVYDKDGKRIGFARGTDNADASSSTSEPSSSTQSSTLDSTLASTSSTSATSSSAPESTSNSLQGLTGQETESAGALGSPTSSAAATANTDHKKNAAVPRLPGNGAVLALVVALSVLLWTSAEATSLF